ncbi:MAG TPA: dihydrolipoyl dehydrogenase [Acidobacteria bacterium]|nr:dihydrolipoyl dehydrogenase [Acidobacteriota bacterium]
MAQKHDLVIIGAGPGGYVAALRAAQLGLDVGCIEKEPALGGTCLRVGCIPTKAMLESSERYDQLRAGISEHGIRLGRVSVDLAALQARRSKIVETLAKGIAGLFRKRRVTRYLGHARLSAPGQVTVEGPEGVIEVQAERILIATGSIPATLPGIAFDGERIVSSTEALTWEKAPSHLVVIGAGAIGLELGSVWRRLGSKVTVLEYLDRILPGMDLELAKEAQRIFKRQGLSFQLGCRVTGAGLKGKTKVVVEIDGREPVEGDRLLVAVGRKPNTDNLGLEAVGITTDQRGRIPVDENYATTIEGIYAIGDVIAGPMLAHKAEEEGVACVEKIVTGYGHVNYGAIPGIVYTHPEIASVGATEEQLNEQNRSYRKGVFPFAANGRAHALGEVLGRVKVLADAQTDRVLGVHIIGPRAGDLIAEATVAIEYGASSEDIARAVHAHPTLAEALKEAALAVDERALHI